ncbi:MAG TPA: hypothetical protein VGQ79_04010 [Nitrospiraceae bacterium]|jgi:hypothetical protein|nr:hypothetical protein [Nitrospiraceae bacterium]
MAETCYHQGKKIILVPSQKVNGTWVCQFTIPEFKGSEIAKYQGYPPGESGTEQEAKVAAFKYAKKILDASHVGQPLQFIAQGAS